MQIVIFGSGSRGDVQPYIALARGLVQAGESVRFVSHQNYAGLAQEYGLEFWPVAGDVQAVAQSQVMRDRVERGNFLLLMAQMAKEAERAGLDLAKVGVEACRGADLILGGLGGMFIGLTLVEKFDLPFLPAYLTPFTPTRAFSSPIFPPLPPIGWLNRVSMRLTRRLMWQTFRPADTVIRKQVLALPPAPRGGLLQKEGQDGMPVLYGFSPAVVPPPADWSANTHVTGYWFLDETRDWQPPVELAQFLDNGPAPVYVGFGSMSHRDPAKTAKLVLDALVQSRQRGVVLRGWGGLQPDDLPATVLMIDSTPHAWLFPRMAAVVHHGGAGTTAAGLRAGAPGIVVPFFGDQPFWGRRVAALGAGPQPIPRKALTAGRLAQAIEQAVHDGDMRQRASELGATIRAEDGVGQAVRLIQSAAG